MWIEAVFDCLIAYSTLSCNGVILSTNKGVNELQCYLVMDIIKSTGSIATPSKTIRTIIVSALFGRFGSCFWTCWLCRITTIKYIVSKCKINLHSTGNRPENLTKKSLFYLLLKLVQINFILFNNARILYISLSFCCFMYYKIYFDCFMFWSYSSYTCKLIDWLIDWSPIA